MKTQTDAVLELLRERGEYGLTPGEALAEVGTMRLAARISDAKALLADDEVIETDWALVNGKRFARYVLRHREPSALRQETLW